MFKEACIMKLCQLLPARKLKRAITYVVLGVLFVALYYIFHYKSHKSNSSVFRWKRSLDEDSIYQTMQTDPFKTNFVKNPLHVLAPVGSWQLNLFHLPKRQVGRLFTEITTANRDTSYLVAPDFTFHIKYDTKSVVLYEDFGPGCMYRNYLYPHLPTSTDLLYKITHKDLRNTYLHLVIDESEYQYSIEQMMLGEEWPFLQPLNTQHPKVTSGLGAYIPICYQEYAKVTYILPENLPQNLFDKTINCSRNDLICPVKIYSGISRHKFPAGSQVSTFTMGSASEDIHAASLLKHPELYSPARDTKCLLKCVDLCTGCSKTIFSAQNPGVIYAMHFRVFKKDSQKVSQDWTNILISMIWDKSAVPQVEKVPLGSFMGATASLNIVKGAAAGKFINYCDYETNDEKANLCIMGYIYYPMPYWSDATIQIESTDEEVTVCYQILTRSNQYSKQTTGYFSTLKTYYETNSQGYKVILDLENRWGHIVGLYMEIDNLVAKTTVPIPERWAALQADPVIFIDGTQSATVFGTGLEDYFSYAHGFALAGNTTYAFVGVHHAVSITKGPQTWHCYRYHVLDPIPFQKSIKFIMEGIQDKHFKPETALSYEQHAFKRKASVPVISHLVVYYAQSHVGMRATDSVQIGNNKSEKEHGFTVLTKPGKSECKSIKSFPATRKRYLGATTTNTVINRFGRAFSAHCSYQFKLKIQFNSGIILRREFHSIPKVWNEKAEIFIDDKSQGVWFIPFGTLSEEYSLREEDFIIDADITKHKTDITVGIRTRTTWRDISYTVFVIEK